MHSTHLQQSKTSSKIIKRILLRLVLLVFPFCLHVAASHQSKNKNAYLILIGMGKDKYSYFYQPDSVVVSFGGYRRDIFEQSLLSLYIQRMY